MEQQVNCGIPEESHYCAVKFDTTANNLYITLTVFVAKISVGYYYFMLTTLYIIQ